MFEKAKKTRPAVEPVQDMKPNGTVPAEPAQANAGGNLPLFFTRPAMVNSDRHAEAGIRMNLPPEFARNTNSMPINVGEFGESAKFYPIAFTMSDPVMPLVIVGLEQENLFVGADGKWREDVYIPAYVRKHPFIFSEEPGNDRLTLCVDEGSPYFTTRAQDENVARLFEGSKPSTYTNNVLSFCTAFHEQYLITRRFCEIIKELGLFEPNRSDIELASGRKIGLSGFQLIDQKKFEQLPENKIMELHKQGWLPLIYYSFLSLSNWRRLVDIAALRETKA